MLTWAHETWPDTVPKIPTNVSLTFIIGVLLITGVASWLKVRKDPTAIAHAGRMTGGDHHEDEAGPTGLTLGSALALDLDEVGVAGAHAQVGHERADREDRAPAPAR